MSKLILTPYIKNGRLDEGRELSRVTLPVSTFSCVQSYSGFFCVNEAFQSNLFFWFFPAEETAGDPPLILWLAGGPGFSALHGMLVGNGPFKVNDDYELVPRQESWTKSHSMLYLDPTVGSGYSHTSSEEGYFKSSEEVASNLYNALCQFFTLFPKFQTKDFYIAGESYGAKHATLLAWKIHSENPTSLEKPINLKGIITLGGFFDGVKNYERLGQHYYVMGLLDKTGLTHFNEKATEIRKLVDSGNFRAAFEMQDKLIGGDLFKGETFFKKNTGYDLYVDILQPGYQMEYITYSGCLIQEKMMKALHVGDTKFIASFIPAFKHFAEDYFKPVTQTFEKLVKLNYKVLVVVGQFDGIIPSFAVEEMLMNIPEYANAERKVWKIKNNVVGYIKNANKLTFALVRNAGHTIPFSKPAECLELLTNFIRNKGF